MPTPRYMAKVLAGVRRLFDEQRAPSSDDLYALLRTARAQTGGEVRAERRAAEAPVQGIAVAAEDRTPPLELAALALADPSSLEARIAAVREAVERQYGMGACVLSTFDDAVIYTFIPMPSAMPMADHDEVEASPSLMYGAKQERPFYRQAYSVTDAGDIALGERVLVREVRRFVEAEDGDELDLVAIDEAPWDGPAPDEYADLDALLDACVHPDGTLRAAMIRAVAAHLDIFDLTGTVRADARAQLREWYRLLGEQSPATIAAADDGDPSFSSIVDDDSDRGGDEPSDSFMRRLAVGLARFVGLSDEALLAGFREADHPRGHGGKFTGSGGGGGGGGGGGAKSSAPAGGSGNRDAAQGGAKKGDAAITPAMRASYATRFSARPGGPDQQGKKALGRDDFHRAMARAQISQGAFAEWGVNNGYRYQGPVTAVIRQQGIMTGIQSTRPGSTQTFTAGSITDIRRLPGPTDAHVRTVEREEARTRLEDTTGNSTGTHLHLEALSPIRDDTTVNALLTEIRLSEGAGDEGALPEWQQLHRIGEWAVPHASGLKIVLTREMGDTMIANFQHGVVRRGIPLDAGHSTDTGGEALGWLTDMRWGSEGDGLPGGPDEPDGTGPILYGHFRYTQLGRAKLSGEAWKYISPQYDLDYEDKEIGKSYGPAIKAVAATNNPFLRIRSIQGETAPEPVVLSDGLVRPRQTGNDAPPDAAAAVRSREESIMPELEEMQARLTEMEAELAAGKAAEARLEALEAANRSAQLQLHEERVQRWVEAQIGRGVSPALLRKYAQPLLLAARPDATPTIMLADEAGAVADDTNPVTLYRAIQEAFEQFGAVSMGRATVSTDTPPGDAVRAEQANDLEVANLQDVILHEILHVPKPNGTTAAVSA